MKIPDYEINKIVGDKHLFINASILSKYVFLIKGLTGYGTLETLYGTGWNYHVPTGKFTYFGSAPDKVLQNLKDLRTSVHKCISDTKKYVNKYEWLRVAEDLWFIPSTPTNNYFTVIVATDPSRYILVKNDFCGPQTFKSMSEVERLIEPFYGR